MKRPLWIPIAAAIALLGGPARPAAGVEIAEVRGDFYYDAQGQLVGHRAAELPEGLERRPMSHREKFELMGLELPPMPRALAFRAVVEKPEQVATHAGVDPSVVIVKFRDDDAVRLRSGRLTSLSGAGASVESILAAHPEAELSRAIRTDERILDENRETGQRLAGRELADLNNYYLIRVPEGSEAGIEIANQLLALDEVETAYLQLRASTPCIDVAPTTPLFEGTQVYRDPAPTGIDADYAWSYAPGGDGYSTGYWVMDLEWDWCLNHEDLDFDVADVVNGHTPNDADAMNHGTAVLGVMGACDNAFGVSGITPNISLKAADFDSEPSYASNIVTADSWLVSGEIMLTEIQLFGPVGTGTCPCNCEQFGGVAVELDQASFDAISTATANGVIVVEAAGNGSMNLDDTSVYGNIFQRWFRDSGAIIVGASTTSHVPSCFTCFGSRVDFHGFGGGVATTGYGATFSGAGDCSQDYTGFFAGTSSASPIIVGACSSLQGVAKQKYGYTLTPAQMRTILAVGATPQAAPLGTNIGPMPDLADAINEIEPDVIPYAPAGWDYPVVPRLTTGATWGNTRLGTGVLLGNLSATYWNAAQANVGIYSPTVDDPDQGIYVSDVLSLIGSFSEGEDLAVGQAGGFNNAGPYPVKGGRQTIRQVADYTDVESERNEANNSWARQFIWSGKPLTAGAPVTETGSPWATSTSYGPWYNAQGFSAPTGSNYWHAFAVMPTNAANDFDIRLNTEIPDNVPQAGFGASVAGSFTGAGEIAFVALDRNTVAAGTYYASVLNFTGLSAGSKVVEFDMDQGTLAPGTNGSFTIAAGELVNLHELYIPAGTAYRIHVDRTAGGADYGLSVFDGTSGFHQKTAAVPGGYADNAGPFEDEFAILDAPTTGDFHGIVVWKKGSADVGQSLTYNIRVSTSPNLIADHQPSGWYGPIVPRNTGGATPSFVDLPDSLNGDAITTRLNWVTYNQGPSPAAAPWQTYLYQDDVVRAASSGATINAGVTYAVLNSAALSIPGGRHHLRAEADALSQLAEFDETDNSKTEWFVWTPEDLADGMPSNRLAPSALAPVGYGPYYSCDGLRAAQSTFWTGVAIVPVESTADYDLRVHDQSTGSKDGFGAYHVWSSDGIGLTDFAVVNHNQVAAAYTDFGVLNLGGSGEYVSERASAPFLGGVTTGTNRYGTYTMDSSEIFDLYEFYVGPLEAGQTFWISLDNGTGAANLGIALFDGNVTTHEVKLSAAELVDANGPGEDEHLNSVTLGQGYHAIAVFKRGSADLPAFNQYDLVISTSSVVAAPELGALPGSFALAAPQPNPFRNEASIQYDVPAAGGSVRVTVFDVHGRKVAGLVDGPQTPGRHSVGWGGRDDHGRRAVSGVYFVRMESPERTATRKVTLLR